MSGQRELFSADGYIAPAGSNRYLALEQKRGTPLSDSQFKETRQHRGEVGNDAPEPEGAYGGPGAAHALFPSKGVGLNPLAQNESAHHYGQKVKDEHRRVVGSGHPGKVRYDYAEEFVPTWRVGSAQKAINNEAVEHQVRNADPLRLDSDPEVSTLGAHPEPGHDAPVEQFVLRDGNHRANAAQRRGQLLMPATVRRPVAGDTPARRPDERLRGAEFYTTLDAGGSMKQANATRVAPY